MMEKGFIGNIYNGKAVAQKGDCAAAFMLC